MQFAGAVTGHSPARILSDYGPMLGYRGAQSLAHEPWHHEADANLAHRRAYDSGISGRGVQHVLDNDHDDHHSWENVKDDHDHHRSWENLDDFAADTGCDPNDSVSARLTLWQ
jgi:hypothetical protein